MKQINSLADVMAHMLETIKRNEIRGKAKNNIPIVARRSFRCKCGNAINKGETYTIQENTIMCMRCAFTEPEKRRLRLIGIRQTT
jgi:aspartate carbamoyltransferase regulatory subunit